MHVLIIDDEPLLADFLVMQLQKLRPKWHFSACYDGLTAFEQLTQSTPIFDAVLCDIQMPEMDGLKLLQLLQQTHVDLPYWVFVTAFNQHAVQAFELAALDYILKPVQADRLEQTLQRLEQNQMASTSAQQVEQFNQQRHLAEFSEAERLNWLKIQVGHKIQLVELKDVDYFQAEDKLVSVILKNQTDTAGVIRKSIKSLKAQLDPNQFIQLHRSLLVKLNAIESIQKDELGHWQAILKSGQQLTISRQYQKQFKGD